MLDGRGDAAAGRVSGATQAGRDPARAPRRSSTKFGCLAGRPSTTSGSRLCNQLNQLPRAIPVSINHQIGDLAVEGIAFGK